MSRPLVLATAVLCALGTMSSGFFDTHLNEITAPLITYANDRAAEIDALPAPTKNEKKERKLVGKLTKKLAKSAKSLKSDFKELTFAAKTATKIAKVGTAPNVAFDEAVTRAVLALDERREFVGDHQDLLTEQKSIDKIAALLEKYTAARNELANAFTDIETAKALAKAEKAITKTLVKAEKEAQKAINTSGGSLPPVRLRSGDQVGAGGARIAIPLTSGTPLAGANVVIPPSALGSLTTITIEAGSDFVTDPDIPAGPSVQLLPPGLQFSQPVRVAVPFELPPGSSPGDVNVVHFDGLTQEEGESPRIERNGTVSAEFTSFSEFQAALPAPPEGVPDGTYHMQIFNIVYLLDPIGDADTVQRAGVFQQDYTFNSDGTGRTAIGQSLVAARTFTDTTPHHVSDYSVGSVFQVDLSWTQDAPRRFTLMFPGADAQTAVADGIVSTDGSVIAFVGRGGPFDFFGIGVRDKDSFTLDDLDGRWLAAELAVELGATNNTPFSTVWSTSLTTLDVDGSTGDVVYGPGDNGFSTTHTFNTNLAARPHTTTTALFDTSGADSWTIGLNGAIVNDDFSFTGRARPDSGVLFGTRVDDVTRRVGLMIAVKKVEGLGSGDLQGLFEMARFDVEPMEAIDPPTPRNESTTDVDTAAGTLAVNDVNVTVSFDSVELASYGLSGPAPWTSLLLSAELMPADVLFNLSLDSDGIHALSNDAPWYGFGAGGNAFVGSTPATDGRDLRGIIIGLR